MTTKYDFYFGFASDSDGFYSMETDRLYSDSDSLSVPVVRFYTWRKATISYGLNQNPFRRLDLERCFADGIEIVARPTGGREILHGWDLCSSVIWPKDGEDSGVDFQALFGRINEMLRTGLEKLGVDASCQTVSRKPVLRDGPCFSQIDRGEISSGGRKLIASAQRIFRNSVLQQSSISLRRPDRDIVEYLKTGSKSEISGRIVNSVAYLEEVLNETFSAPQIVEIYKGVFEAEMGQSGRLRMPENIEVKKSINIEK